MSHICFLLHAWYTPGCSSRNISSNFCQKYLVLIIDRFGYAALKVLLLVGLQISVHVVVLKQCIKHLKVLVMALDHHLYVHTLPASAKPVLIQWQR